MTASFPEWVEPMAATLTQERFIGPEWIFERKYDGIRLLAFMRHTQVRLLSRNRLPQHRPDIAAAVSQIAAHDVILDGELTWGKSGAVYHVFDLLWLNGRDVTPLQLVERLALLDTIKFSLPLERVLPVVDPKPWELACREGWEGVIAKRRDSRYEHRRSPHWLKMKCEASREFVIGGFTDPQGARAGLGALLVGYFENEDLVFAGKVGTGFDTKLLLDLRAQLDALEIPGSPFTKAVGLPRVRAHWVRPHIAVQVAFIEWTKYGKLRHSRLLGVSTGQSAGHAKREGS